VLREQKHTELNMVYGETENAETVFGEMLAYLRRLWLYLCLELSTIVIKFVFGFIRHPRIDG
jgi:hypothetical protein